MVITTSEIVLKIESKRNPCQGYQRGFTILRKHGGCSSRVGSHLLGIRQHVNSWFEAEARGSF